VDRERRPVDYSYVITLGTFLIGRWGNNLIADSQVGALPGEALLAWVRQAIR
jgi:hypothetical protein